MDLLPTGSDKLLVIRTEQLDIVFRPKKKQTAVRSNPDERSSSVLVAGYGIESVRIENQDISRSFEPSGRYNSIRVDVSPMFFEQTDYELVVRSKNNQPVFVWHESPLIRDKISPVVDDNNTLVTGIINFDSQGNATILHNGSDGKGGMDVNERTRSGTQGSFDTWFPEYNNPVKYKMIGE